MQDISGNFVASISSNNLPTTFHGESINFFLAANITNINQKVAVDNLVRDLKVNNLWDKMVAIYPLVGGTADTHKWNLKDPRDLNAAYRLIFTSVTHSSGGITHTGSTTTGADTNIRASSFSAMTNNLHVSVYSRTNLNDGFGTNFGGALGLNSAPSNSANLNIYPSYGGAFQSRLADNAGLGTGSNPAVTTSLGFYLVTRTSSASKTYFKNGVNLGTSAHTSISLSGATSNIILGRNVGDATNRQIAFASFGSGLTTSESVIFSQIVEAYQYRLYRNVSLTI